MKKWDKGFAVGLVMAIAAAVAVVDVARAAEGDELVIGMSTPLTTLDPTFHNQTQNNSNNKHVFETLVTQDEAQKTQPGLAESWKVVDDTTWEFKLRAGVKWHDGTDFTANDVIATLKRIPIVPNSPGSYVMYIRTIVEATAPDPLTLRLKTNKPNPLLLNDLPSVHILPKRIAETAKTEDFNSGAAMIGTGPYKFAEYVAGDRVAYIRNDKYWGPKPAFAKIRFKMITNSPARVAALLAGDVHMIEAVPTADIPKLSKDPRIALSSARSNRVIYLHMDSGREKNSPFVTDRDGKPMEANPFRDQRVRKAISKMIDRDLIVSRIMQGVAQPAGQLLPEEFFGTSKLLKPEKYDLAGARKLLAEAGYADGFGVTLHTPNNRYINDEKIAQAVAQFLTRGGIPTKVEGMPSAVFSTRSAKAEFSFVLAGWGSETGEPGGAVRSLLATYDAARGMGPFNRGRFSNPEVDAMLDQALTIMDDPKRGLALAAVTEKAIGELQGIIPLHYEVTTWALKKGLTYKARADQYTLGYNVQPEK
jgi:peptide/nickel transport system substrate-binding protein